VHRRCAILFAFFFFAPLRSAAAQEPQLPYRDARLSVDARVRDLVGRMTLDEKFWQLFMIPGDLDDPAFDYSNGIFGLQISAKPTTGDAARAHAERINAIQKYFVERTRLGIPIIPFDEAVHGLMREGATVFPQAIGLAATWDTTLVGQVSRAIARETRSRGIRQVLSPVINIATDVRWGRVEETYGEDPFLTSMMGTTFVSAFESAGIVATPKHFIANVGEGGRDSYPIDISRRALEEIHFPPFKATIERGHARSVMSAYNSVDGSPATQSKLLLGDILKREWNFSGFVISDAAATGGATVLHHTEASTATATKDAFEAGLDVVFQSSWPQHRPYLDAFKRGLVAESIINASVSRVLKAKFELGLFEHPFVDPDSAARWNNSPEHRAIARTAARESIVLLKNEHNALPLSRGVRSIAVIGTDASEARLGGYSGPGVQPVSILSGIRDAVGRTSSVRFAAGPGRVSREYTIVDAEQLSSVDSGRTVHGLRGEYFDNNRLTGAPRFARTDPQINFGWTLNSPGRGIPFDWYSVRWTGKITVPKGGVKRIGVEGNDGYRLYIDNKLVVDDWIKRSYGSTLANVNFQPGSTHDVRLEYFESTGNARVKLVWDAGVTNDWTAKIRAAVDTARKSDVAIVVAGLEEGEFRDRALLSLPGHQEELIERVAAVGKPTIVVLAGGSAITMSRWIDKVAGVVDVWYPGVEGGHAVADVLFGDYNPAGRLPITFAMSEGQLPLVYNHKPTGRGDDYLDLTGQPLFPFGFGLSYTTFEYSNLSMTPSEVHMPASVTIRCTVTNTGKRAGDEVAQLYLHDVLASVARPVMQLAGFQRIHLEPGESRSIQFTVAEDQLRMLDRDMHWVVEPGAFRVMIGGSSRDIRLRDEFVIR